MSPTKYPFRIWETTLSRFSGSGFFISFQTFKTYHGTTRINTENTTIQKNQFSVPCFSVIFRGKFSIRNSLKVSFDFL